MVAIVQKYGIELINYPEKFHIQTRLLSVTATRNAPSELISVALTTGFLKPELILSFT